MPFYQYHCEKCSLTESRIAGVDDHTVSCTSCGGRMTRTTGQEDLFRAYWEPPQRSQEKIPGSA